jgi:hypothetical protein
MGCLIHFVGREADVDQLVALSPVAPCTIWRRGEPRSSRPNSKKSLTSGVNLEVSEADFEELEQQQAEAIRFLRAHASALRNMREVAGVERASLDFGIAMRNVVVQSDRFPAELIAALATIGCELTGQSTRTFSRRASPAYGPPVISNVTHADGGPNKSFETDTQLHGAARPVGDRRPRGAMQLRAAQLQR